MPLRLLAFAIFIVLSASGASFQCGTPDVAVSRIDLDTGEVRRVADPGGVGIGHIAAGAGAVWVTSDDGLKKIDPRSGDVVRALGAVEDFVATRDRLWAVDAYSQEVVELDRSGREVARHAVGSSESCQPDLTCTRLAVARERAWAVNPLTGILRELVPGGRRGRRITIGRTRGVTAFAVSGERAWLATGGVGRTLLEVDLRRGEVAARRSLDRATFDLAATDGTLWAAHGRVPELRRVVPARPALRVELPRELYPTHLNREGGGLWVTLLKSAFGDGDTAEGVFQIDSRNGRIVRRIGLELPVDVTVGFGAAWVVHEG
jgi:hypothetical protein